jgi:hypothetical protein
MTHFPGLGLAVNQPHTLTIGNVDSGDGPAHSKMFRLQVEVLPP